MSDNGKKKIINIKAQKDIFAKIRMAINNYKSNFR